MAYPVRDFLPGRRLFVAGAAATFISATTARAEISSSLIRGAMKRFKLTRPPKPVPDLEFLDVNDQPVRLSELNGQARLINLWATWCAPCVKEMPSLDSLQAIGEDGGEHLHHLPVTVIGACEHAPHALDRARG